MSTTIIDVAKDFSAYPGPRYRADGPFSGEDFREQLLAPALRKAIGDGGLVIVIIDGVAGYGSSFLDESFAGLLRTGFDASDLKKHLSVEAKTNRFQHHLVRLKKYINEESRRRTD